MFVDDQRISPSSQRVIITCQFVLCKDWKMWLVFRATSQKGTDPLIVFSRQNSNQSLDCCLRCHCYSHVFWITCSFAPTSWCNNWVIKTTWKYEGKKQVLAKPCSMLYPHHPHIDRIALEEAAKKSQPLILFVTNTGENVWWTLFSWGVEVSLRLRAQNFDEKISCMIWSLLSCGYSTVCSVLMCFTFENWMNDCIKRQQNK